MEFVKSNASKKELRDLFINFYLGDKYADQKGDYFCDYDIYCVKIFIKLARKKLIFDCFEYLVDYLVAICKTRTKRCFRHLEVHDCLNYFPLEHNAGRVVSLVEFYLMHNFNIGDPFRILEIIPTKTRYGDTQIIKFCSEYSSFKTWLPKSGLKTIAEVIEKTFDF